MAHFRTENLRFGNVIYCLPSTGPYEPWVGKPAVLPSFVIPSDLPSPLPASLIDEYAKNPEQTLMQFLESNPNLNHPRDIGRMLFHTPGISPYANALILFNSMFSSRALVFSFVTAIDLDCLSLVDAIRYITTRVAIPTHPVAIIHLTTAFSHAYQLRNQLEWPDPKVVNDIFCASIIASVSKIGFIEATKRFPSLDDANKIVLDRLAENLSAEPIPLYFTSMPVKVEPNEYLEAELEHEGRYRSSWSPHIYVLAGKKLSSHELKNRAKIISQAPLDQVVAHQKIGIKLKPWVMTIQRLDNQEFGQKMKDGALKQSPRTNYTLAFKTEEELMHWISSINFDHSLENIDNLSYRKDP